MKIFKLVFIAAVLALGFYSCNDDEDTGPSQLEKDIAVIEAYLAANNIVADTQKTTEIRYLIEQQGYGAYPTAYSTIKIKYKGYLTDGTVFDETVDGNSLIISLGSVISGWQYVIPYFREGAKGMLFIPSGYGYGDTEKGDIPANSVLIFEINLLEVY
ncbi:MAG: FKBP-type peptidyl-prolyl cis-trans isomerase [Bacteroidales bacterium]|nr:FKBP-type peptidyl-prolyl cis-trans isomerase [Bacteroidales bacterium]MBN2819744.1 FKBP-type peptidyl-prolyl cis-trans isomerase [Bacteroidales bacterium]